MGMAEQRRKDTVMPLEKVPEPETGEIEAPEKQEENLAEEAADFITSQVLDKGANFFEG